MELSLGKKSRFFVLKRMCTEVTCFWCVWFWVVTVCVVPITILVPTSSVVTVVDLKWIHEQDIEEFSELQQDAWDWHVPHDAYDQRSELRLHVYGSWRYRGFEYARWTSFKVKRWQLCETLRTTGHDQNPQSPDTTDLAFDLTPVLGNRRLSSTRAFYEVEVRAPGHDPFWYGVEPSLFSRLKRGDPGLWSETALGLFKDVLFDHEAMNRLREI